MLRCYRFYPMTGLLIRVLPPSEGSRTLHSAGLATPGVASRVKITSWWGALHSRASGSGDVYRDASAILLLKVELDFLPHRERPEAFCLNRRLVHEHVTDAV